MNNIVRAVKATVLVMTMALLTTVGAANTNDAWLCVIKANDAALCEASYSLERSIMKYRDLRIVL